MTSGNNFPIVDCANKDPSRNDQNQLGTVDPERKEAGMTLVEGDEGLLYHEIL